ncbi:hypothetical protein GCM10010336_70690 [Streptomyces goshikiensis]|nr:hypothetical protein GCM10010336_70690 [Streptomyces goshikiensis]
MQLTHQGATFTEMVDVPADGGAPPRTWHPRCHQPWAANRASGAFRVPVPLGVRMRDAAWMEERPCQPCGGLRVTEHTEHAVETDESGNQRPVIRQWTGPCGACGGSGVTYQ